MRCGPGAHLVDIERVTEAVASVGRRAVVRDLCCHGIGQVFHDIPDVLKHGRLGNAPELRPGMFLAVEPMLNLV